MTAVETARLNASVHSAAPWRIEGKFDDEVAVSIVSADDFDICEVYPLTGEWSPEDIANAHAVKAAPQLLKCLKEAVGLADLLHGASPEWLAAIASAEGEESA